MPTITSVILAGGQAKRFNGQDKGLIKLGQKHLIEYSLARLSPQVDEIIINANRHLEQYHQFGYRVMSDTIGDYWGPLAGIASVMQVIHTDYLLVVPCDSPLIPEDFVKKLLNGLQTTQSELSVGYDGTDIQPLFALLRCHLLSSLTDYLQRGGRKVSEWYTLHTKTLVDFSDQPHLFFNVNTPSDLATLQRLL